MVKIIPYILVDKGLNAIETYKKVFNAEMVSHQPFNKDVGDDMGLPEDFDYENSTMHATIKIDDEPLYLADNSRPDKEGSSSVDVLLELDSKEQIEEIVKNAKEEGFVFKMKLDKTFWGAWFARIVDPYGIGWQLNFQEDKQE